MTRSTLPQTAAPDAVPHSAPYLTFLPGAEMFDIRFVSY